MIRVCGIVLVAVVLATVGCGPTHRLVFEMPSAQPGSYVSQEVHHGLGLIGGGLFYLAASQIFPRLIRYSDPIDIGSLCPNGFSEVRQFHTAESNLYSGFLSWLIILDPYHTTDVEIRCAR